MTTNEQLTTEKIRRCLRDILCNRAFTSEERVDFQIGLVEKYAAQQSEPIQANNAMLADACKALLGPEMRGPFTTEELDAGLFDEWQKESDAACKLAKETLAATHPTITKWLEECDKKAVEAYLGAGAYADVCKQLATVTDERDGLREMFKDVKVISEKAVKGSLKVINKVATDALAQKPAGGQPPH